MNIFEARAATDEGKKVRQPTWEEGRHIIRFGDKWMTNENKAPIAYDFTAIFGRWEIVEEPMTVDDYKWGLDILKKEFFESKSSFYRHFERLVNGERFWSNYEKP